MLGIARPSAKDPLTPLRQVVQEFENSAAQLRHLASSRVLVHRLTSLREWIARSTLQIDIAFDGALTKTELSEALGWADQKLTTDDATITSAVVFRAVGPFE